MTKSRVFRSEKDRDRICAESLEAVKLLKAESEDYLSKARQLIRTALEARPRCTPALTLSVALCTKAGDLVGATKDLTTLIQCEEAALQASDDPVLTTMYERRRLAANYGQRAGFARRLESEESQRDDGKAETYPLNGAGCYLADYQRAMELEPDNGIWPYELSVALLRGTGEVAGTTVEHHVGRVDDANDDVARASALLQSAISCFQAQLSAPPHQPLTATSRAHRAAGGRSHRGAAAAGGAGGPAGTLKNAAVMRFKCQLLLARCLLRMGEASRTLRLLKAAKEQNDIAEIHALLGYSYEQTGDLSAAREEFQRAAEMESRNVTYQLNVGVCQLRQGLMVEALPHLNEAALLDKGNPWLHFYRGCACLLLGERAQGLLAVQNAIELDRKPEFLFLQGTMYFDEGDLLKATDCFREVARQETGSEFTASFLIGLVAELLGSPFEAVEHYHDALRTVEGRLAAQQVPEKKSTARGEPPLGSREAPGSRNAADRPPSPSKSTARGSSAPKLSPTTVASPTKPAPGDRVSPEKSRDAHLDTRCAQRDVLFLLLSRVGLCYANLGHFSSALRYLARGTLLSHHESNVFPPGHVAQIKQCLRLFTAQVQLRGGNPLAAWRLLHEDAQDRSPESDVQAFDELHCLSVALEQLGESCNALLVSDKAELLLPSLEERERQTATSTHPPVEALLESDVPLVPPKPVARRFNWDDFSGSGDAIAHYMNRANILFSLGEYERCGEIAQTGLTQCASVNRADDRFNASRQAELYYLLARAQFALAQHEAAVSSFEAAANALPDLAKTVCFSYALGVALVSSGRQHDGLRWLSNAISAGRSTGAGMPCLQQHLNALSAPSDEQIVKLAYHERAKLNQSLGNARDAVADFSHVLASQPRNFNALVRRAFALKEVGDFSAAAADWMAAGALDDTGTLCEIDVHYMFDTPFIELCEPGEEEVV